MSIVIRDIKKEEIYAKELLCGDTCRVTDTMYTGQILLRTGDGFVSLSNPHLTWGKDCMLKVVKIECELIVK